MIDSHNLQRIRTLDCEGAFVCKQGQLLSINNKLPEGTNGIAARYPGDVGIVAATSYIGPRVTPAATTED